MPEGTDNKPLAACKKVVGSEAHYSKERICKEAPF